MLCLLSWSRNPPRNIVEKESQKLRKDTGDSATDHSTNCKSELLPKSPKPPSCVHLFCSASLLSFGHHVHVSVVRFALHVLFAYPIVYQEGKGWSASKLVSCLSLLVWVSLLRRWQHLFSTRTTIDVPRNTETEESCLQLNCV